MRLDQGFSQPQFCVASVYAELHPPYAYALLWLIYQLHLPYAYLLLGRTIISFPLFLCVLAICSAMESVFASKYFTIAPPILI